MSIFIRIAAKLTKSQYFLVSQHFKFFRCRSVYRLRVPWKNYSERCLLQLGGTNRLLHFLVLYLGWYWV